MIVWVVTDSEMTFTGDLFKIAWQNNDFVFKHSLPQKQNGYGPLRNSGERSNFSFDHSVFYPFGELSLIFINFDIVVFRLLQFGKV